jgi:hypothetical protein
MHDGVDLAHKSAIAGRLTVTEATRLHKSINAYGDPDRMKDDTIFRTDRKCGANNAERINGIAESFHQLNGGRDGG